MSNTIPVSPLQRVKEIWHTFFKKPYHNFYTAKDDAITLIEIYIKEAQFGNHLEAVSYWEQVKMEAENL